MARECNYLPKSKQIAHFLYMGMFPLFYCIYSSLSIGFRSNLALTAFTS